jgi:hypothetical protein
VEKVQTSKKDSKIGTRQQLRLRNSKGALIKKAERVYKPVIKIAEQEHCSIIK